MNVSFSITTILQHLLFLFLLIVAPAWDYYDTRRLKRNPTSPARTRYYATECAWLWGAAIAAFLLVGWRSLAIISPAPEEMGWLFQHIWVRYIIAVVLFTLAAIIAWTYLAVLIKRLKNEPRKYASSNLMQKVSYAYLFPATRAERRWWVLVGLTAGICEEALFRGFLLHYLHTSPWRLNLTLALLLSALIFGLQHLYQGVQGVIVSAVLGALFGLLFLLSGSLLLPMLLHAALDLRLLVILRPATE
jgi:membrane protease YdiL (CAAX protease family)